MTKQKGKDIVVSFRLDEPVVERFGDYAYYKRLSKKKALETIITEYLDGRGLDEDTRRVLERFDSEVRKGSITQPDTPESAEKVDGRDRYEVRGIQAEDIIAEVMERVESSEGFGMSQAWDVGNALKYLLRAGRKDALSKELGKAENYLHHALTGQWLESNASSRVALRLGSGLHPTRRSVRQIRSSHLLGYRGHFNVATQGRRVLQPCRRIGE